jgi:hypothetical protein
MSDESTAKPEGLPFQMPIELGKVREFARATGGTSPDYLENPSAPIPPTFLRTQVFWTPAGGPNLLKDVKLDLRRILHGEQEYEFFGPPPHVGDELTVTTRLDSVEEKDGKRGGKMLVIVFISDFTDGDGALVARGRQTLIQTGGVPA